MYKKLVFFLFFALFLVSLHSMAEDTNVVWLHGLTKNAETLQVYANLFAVERKMQSANQTYPTTTGMSNARSSAISNTNTALGTNATNPNNIAIGYDIGGLVARDIDKVGSYLFGGIVTVGTPNQGLYLANAFQNGGLQQYTDDAHSRLDGINLTVGGAAVVGSDLANLAEDYAYSHFNNPTGLEIQEGSEFINGLPANISVPSVYFWGHETSPVHWRFLSSIQNPPHSLPLDVTKDGVLADQVRNYKFACQHAQTKHTNAGIFHIFGTIGLAVAAAVEANPVIAVLAAIDATETYSEFQGRNNLNMHGNG